tara:strand:- start:671 stop:916 length:246 start_codon:yes stop_codon:yes gene_type:complete
MATKKIKTELTKVYITSDGCKFLCKDEAKFWQDHLNRVDDQILKEFDYSFDIEEHTNYNELERIWRQTKAKQRAIDLKKKL